MSGRPFVVGERVTFAEGKGPQVFGVIASIARDSDDVLHARVTDQPGPAYRWSIPVPVSDLRRVAWGKPVPA